MKFNVNEDKTLETLIWIATAYPKIDISKAFLILYHADKLHLNRYARPVTGDSYVVKDGKIIPAFASKALHATSFDVVHGIIYTTRIYDPNKFSKSDFECLWEVVYKDLEIPLIEGPIPIEDMLDIDNEYRCQILEELKETAPYMLV